MKFQEASPEQIEKTGLFYIYRRTVADSRPLPLVVLLHGRTGDEKFIWQFGRLFSEIPAIIVAPRAPVIDPDGGFTWWEIGDQVNKAPGTPFVVNEMINAGARAIDDFIQGILEEFIVDEKRIFGIGFSQGGMAGSYLSILKPKLFYGIGLLSSALPVVLNPDIKFPVVSLEEHRTNYFIAHGILDRIIEIKYAYKTMELLQARSFEAELVTEEVSHKVGSNGMKALTKWFQRLNV